MQAVVAAGVLLLAVAISAQTVIPFTACGDACQIQDIYWSTPTTGVLITANQHSNASYRGWQTTDSGVTWSPILRNVDSIVNTGPNSTVIYFPWFSGKNMNYSVDGGVTLYAATLPCFRKQIVEFQPHPTQKGWILITGCESSGTGTLSLCSLYTSQDYGKTWQTSFYRDLVDGVAMWGNSTQNLIFVWRNNWNYGYTTDFGKSFNKIFDDTFGFVLTRHYQFVAVAGVGTVTLYASSYREDPTHTSKSSYHLAEFPFGDQIPQDFYTFIDDITRAEYIGVHYGGVQPGQERPWGTIYSSEFDGSYYQMSLPYVFAYNTGGGFSYDFRRFHGLNGIYIANSVLNSEEWQNPTLISQITYDNGATWQFLNKPASDMNGKPWNCANPNMCALHLTGSAAQYELGIPTWTTHTSAIGLIAANGNVGEWVGDGPLSTFFSRDAGVTWTQIFAEPTLVSFGNHGGILVLAPVWNVTTLIYYSFDQGTHINSYTISSTPLYIYDLSTDPAGAGTKFIVGGIDATGNYVVLTFDLSAQLTNQCQQPGDFEQWAPNSGQMTPVPCFMGADTVYLRRKQNSICYNSFSESDMIYSQTPCPCTWLDYECEFNYDASGRNSTLGFGCNKVSADPQCTPGQQYHVPTGYVLVPDTMCNLTSGLNLLGPRKTCSKSHPSEVAAAVIVTLLIVGTIVGVIALYLKNDRFRSWVKSLTSGRGHRKYREINNVEDDDNTPFLSGR